jgi:hypothetical protein
VIKARALSNRDIDGLSLSVSNTSPSISKPLRSCARCGEKVDAKLTECPKCGVIFDKIKKIRVGEPLKKDPSADLTAAWIGIRNNYADLKNHETFIQLCLNKENLAFASQQYRAVLDANPSDDIANKMQNRIIELATFSYITAKATGEEEKPRYAGFTKFITVVAGLLIVSGVFFSWARPMIAIGVSVLVFVLAAKYFAK